MTSPFTQLDALIADARRIVLTAHDHPDGDAVGALLGLSYLVERRGKDWLAFTNDAPPAYFDYLDLGRITSDRARLRAQPFDLVIFLDVGDVKRSFVTPDLLHAPSRPPVANLDHHPTITAFDGGSVVDLNIVDRRVSSTSEIVYEFIRATNEPLTRPIATCLLTGILTDTGTFSNLGTTRSSLEVAARLLRRGALIQEVNDRTWKNKSTRSLQLWGRIFSRLKQNPATGLVTTAVFLRDLAECHVDPEAIEGLSNFLNSLDDAHASLLLKELPNGLVNGSYRTTQPDVDVSKLAAAYGGGGHIKAAGFTIPGRIVETDVAWEVDQAPSL